MSSSRFGKHPIVPGWSSNALLERIPEITSEATISMRGTLVQTRRMCLIHTEFSACIHTTALFFPRFLRPSGQEIQI